MDENTFWINVWRLIAGVAVAFIVTLGSCTAYESKRIADAVEAGKDPIAARCGIAGPRGTSEGTICGARAAR